MDKKLKEEKIRQEKDAKTIIGLTLTQRRLGR